MIPMASIPELCRLAGDAISDEDVVRRIRSGETELYEILMRRYNQRLYRVARSILRNEAEAEDVMQEAYVRAYEHLDQFAGTAKFSTWLTKIAVYEALGRLRRYRRMENVESHTNGELPFVTQLPASTPTPERQSYDRELRLVLEHAIDTIPDHFRSVFVLRVVEGLSVAETAEALQVSVETVKSRFHRARRLLRKALHHRAGILSADLFPFHLSRCDRVVEGVFQRIGLRG